jgi:hypothetical protein
LLLKQPKVVSLPDIEKIGKRESKILYTSLKYFSNFYLFFHFEDGEEDFIFQRDLQFSAYTEPFFIPTIFNNYIFAEHVEEVGRE